MALYREVTSLHEGREVDVYLNFSNDSDTVCHNILIIKLTKHGLDSGQWGGLKTDWRPRVWPGAKSPFGDQWPVVYLQGSTVGPMLLNITVNDLNNEAQHTLNKFSNSKRVGTVKKFNSIPAETTASLNQHNP